MTETSSRTARPPDHRPADGSEVYAPQADTRLLAEAVHRAPPRPGSDVLDLCTGSGALALVAAAYGARVTAVDLSEQAVAAARLNSARASLPVRVVRGDLFEPVARCRFDLILCNPPYVPADSPRLPTSGRSVAWDAGPDGRAVLDRVCAGAPRLLKPGGALLLVHSALSGTVPTLTHLRRQGLKAEVVCRRQVPFGPVLRSRAAWLQSRGLIAPGETMEGLVIIRAERPR
ncbi:HemK2/MTQ2 family protein methyltransferase [Streptomyces sp. t39]|uniref:HemK2/MTQ2 family protein methyltransferase n=1 Tax=Streptomyces sp. t39 TaxID=1828156 RepID=UPI0011CEC3E9|nr:HemK2/MTQ2 family protein methyltransferase [Streptomyces sp. t39]TXS52873.1 methyltransferase domain-containing protein [Streptomyces sp. t39]